MLEEQVLSANWYTLKKYSYEILKKNGKWEKQSREVKENGDSYAPVPITQLREWKCTGFSD